MSYRCLASNGDLSPANSGSVRSGYDGTGSPGRDRNRAYGRRLLHVGMAPSNGLIKLWGQPVECIAPCPRVLHAGNVGLSSSVADTLDRALRVYSAPMRVGRRGVSISPLT